MSVYLLEMSSYWAAFYLLYLVLLRRQTFFGLNRAYLLVTFGLGLLLPLLDIPVGGGNAGILSGVWLPVAEVGAAIEQAPVAAASVGGWPWWLLIWVAGSVMAGARLWAGLWQIGRLLKSSRKEYKSGYVLVRTGRLHMPFSFGRYLFWSDRFEPASGEASQILKHEEAHIRQRHSLDVLILEIAIIVLWWHPLVYAFRYALRQVHEYLADAAVLRYTPRKQYGTLLLLQLQPGLQPALANHFFHSQLKSRLQMMTRPPSRRKAALRYLLVLPVLTVSLYACNLEKEGNLSNQPTNALAGGVDPVVAYTQQDTIVMFDPETYEESTQVVSQQIFKVVEEMPRFPGCEDPDKDPTERDQCAQAELLKFIFTNIKYPDAARTAGIEGTVVVQFVVTPDGQVVDPELLRSIGGGCDEEVLRIIGEMPPWIPGRQRGKAVAVQFNLPVKFRLEE